MDGFAWLWWGLVKLLELILSVTWFLVSGWVATAVQLVLLVGVVFALRYGWRRAPGEMGRRTRKLAHFVWAWVRGREVRSPSAPRTDPWARTAQPTSAPPRSPPRTPNRPRRRRPGDVSVSTLLTLAVLTGLLVAVSL